MHDMTCSQGALYVDAKAVEMDWASTTFTPTLRMNVDLPVMFAPVMSRPWGASRDTEFGTGAESRGW